MQNEYELKKLMCDIGKRIYDRNMVAANAGITFMPELAVLNEGTRKGVKYIPCHSPEPARTIALVYRPGSPLRNRYERVANAISEQVKSILANKK